ncbi:sensor histidine kinase [Corynebacterium nuruki]|uniref:Sensor histidine kinase n=1 Tax=Corynebacterium nuruki TaxID=1032851 RepID=A0A3D4T476_9CORY|nr:sensor histidine kinase [Corynebacterium nuruki]HCT15540.1 sensor histidine kinase [Corynebacterium nuruki]
MNSVLVRSAVAGLLGVLLAVTVLVAADRHGTPPTVLVVTAVLFALAAAVGLTRPFPVRTGRRVAWLALLTVLWLVLALQEATAAYLVLALFVLYLLLLPAPWGAVTTGVVTMLAVAVSVSVAGPSTGAVLGPVLSGAAAIAIAVVVESITAVSEDRRRLIDELVRTRGLLAESERQAGVVAERQRLAHEIHDTVAQGLSGIQLLLHAAERGVPEDSPAVAQLRLAREVAADNLRETRAMIAALQPADLQEGSLVDALRRLAAGPGGTAGAGAADGGAADAGTADGADGSVTVSVDVEGDAADLGLSVTQEAALLRIAQSAVANIRLHAHAEQARITLTVEADAVRLDIVDNGRGFDVAAAAAAAEGRADEGHIGLAGMRRRALGAGGTFDVESFPAGGTAVVVSMPRHSDRAQ